MVIKTNILIKSNVLSSLKKTSISLVRISLSIHAFVWEKMSFLLVSLFYKSKRKLIKINIHKKINDLNE
jgi:hypothetical protein